MKAYFCSGVYHLFTVINLRLMDINTDADCYIFNCFNNAEERYKKLKESKLFNNVFLINEDSDQYNFIERKSGIIYQIKKTLGKMKTRLKKGDYSKYKLGNYLYDEIFLPGYYPFLHRYLMVLYKNKKCINFYDEGLGCRLKGGFIYKHLIGRVLGFYKFEKIFKKVYMYNFNLVEDKFGNVKRCLIKNLFIENQDLFLDIFNVKKDEILKFRNAKIVILPTGISNQPAGDNSDELLDKENNVYHYVIKNYSEVVLKNHPGSSVVFDCICLDKTIPFELLCADENLEDKIFVTSFSTTLFNIKYLFNKEPNVFLIYKAMGLPTKDWFKKSDEESDAIMKKFLIDAYEKKGRVFIPESVEKFKEELERVYNETKN